MRLIIIYFKKIFSANKFFLFINIILTVIASATQVLIPLYLKFFFEIVEKNANILKIINLFLLFILFLLISNIISILWHYFMTKLGAKILFELQENLMRKLNEINYEKINLIGKEKLKNIIFNDTFDIFILIANFIINISAKIFILFFIFIIILTINIKIALILLIFFVLELILSNYSRKKIRNASKEVNIELKAINSFLNIFIESVKLFHTFPIISYFFNKHKELEKKFIYKALKSDKIQVFFKNLLDNINYIATIGIITILIVNGNSNKIGNLVLIMYYVNLLSSYSHEIALLITSIGEALPALENVDEILSQNVEKSLNLKLVKIEDIRFNNVCFSYKDTPNKKILNKINLHFFKGDKVRITGANGSGKTTFINLITGILIPTEGNILINNCIRQDYEQEILKSKILYIGQEDIFLNEKLLDFINIITEKENNINDIGTILNNWNFWENLEEKYNLQLDYKGEALSGGQRKKISILKLIFLFDKADIIILDELDANLDINSKKKLDNFRKEILFIDKEKIIIEISHDINLDLSNYNKIIEIKNGNSFIIK